MIFHSHPTHLLSSTEKRNLWVNLVWPICSLLIVLCSDIIVIILWQNRHIKFYFHYLLKVKQIRWKTTSTVFVKFRFLLSISYTATISCKSTWISCTNALAKHVACIDRDNQVPSKWKLDDAGGLNESDYFQCIYIHNGDLDSGRSSWQVALEKVLNWGEKMKGHVLLNA